MIIVLKTGAIQAAPQTLTSQKGLQPLFMPSVESNLPGIKDHSKIKVAFDALRDI